MTKITNSAAGVRIVNAKVGGKVQQVSLAPGETKDLDVVETKAHKARVERGDFKVGAKAVKEPEKAFEGYAVTDKGRGWFVITKDGAEVTKSLREDDVKGFADKSDEDKAKFVEAAKPE